MNKDSSVSVLLSLVWTLQLLMLIFMKPVGVLTHQGAAPALLPRRHPALPVLPAGSSSASGRSLHGLIAAGLVLPVLVGPLGFGLQAALVQGVGLLPVHLLPLHHRGQVALLAVVVMLPELLDPPAEPLHHLAASRCNKIRHHQ